MTTAVLGVDAGGTKTAGVLVTSEGEVRATACAGGGNYQAIGLRAAGEVYADVIRPLLTAARRDGLDVSGAGFGLSGLDRPVDSERLRGLITPLLPDVEHLALVNDTSLILRAGTRDGVGVAVVSGTGSNCVGRGPEGVERRIGGFGFDFGDDGSAHDIGRDGARAAFRAADGRAEPTALTGLIMARYGLAELHDLVDRFLPDAEDRQTAGALAPLVFEAALAGDAICQAILVDAGQSLAHAAIVVARQLFALDDAVPIVLGGAVWQQGQGESMREAFGGAVREVFPAAMVSVLQGPPVIGAALLALDGVASEAAQDASVHAALLEGARRGL